MLKKKIIITFCSIFSLLLMVGCFFVAFNIYNQINQNAIKVNFVNLNVYGEAWASFSRYDGFEWQNETEIKYKNFSDPKCNNKLADKNSAISNLDLIQGEKVKFTFKFTNDELGHSADSYFATLILPTIKNFNIDFDVNNDGIIDYCNSYDVNGNVEYSWNSVAGQNWNKFIVENRKQTEISIILYVNQFNKDASIKGCFDWALKEQ